MPDVSATEAARHFADLLDGVEHRGEHYRIVRRGKVVAHLEPIGAGHGRAVKSLLRSHRPDPEWTGDLEAVRDLLELDDRV